MNWLRKFGATAVIIATLVTAAGPALIPYKSEAFGTAVFDVPNTFQGVLNAIANTANNVNTYFLNYKESVLDGIAYYVAKAVIRSITSSIVDWINNGFEGSPSFISNPGNFFKNIVDEEIGAFIEGSALGFLCQPFNIDIRLQLALNYRPFKRRVTCTLSQVFGNVEGAAEDFTRGNFLQGGWAGWASLTTQPQNNRYGAYLEAQGQLSASIGGIELFKTQELDRSNGFLAWKRCKPTSGTPPITQGDPNFVGPPVVNGQYVRDNLEQASNFDDRYGVGASRQQAQDDIEYNRSPEGTAERTRRCGPNGQLETVTPGSMISNQLETVFGSPIRELELADEFNEILNALMVQMLKMAFGQGQGILGLSESSSGGNGSSFLQRIENDQDPIINEQIKKELLPQIQKATTEEGQYRDVAASVLTEINMTNFMFDQASSCVSMKLATTSGQLRYRSQETALREIQSDITIYRNNALIPEIAPWDARFQTLVRDSNAAIVRFNQMQEALNKATTTNALNAVSDTFRLTYNPSRQTVTQYLVQERDGIIEKLRAHQVEAQEFKRACDNIIIN